VKNCITPYGNYNSGTLEDTCTLGCLHQTGGFRGRPIEWCPSNLPLTDPCCHDNQPPLFERKIGNACMGDTTPIPEHNRGLSGSVNLTVLVKFVPDQPVLPWRRKFENFNRKFAITRLIEQICRRFLHQTGGFLGRPI